jgi:hypothetical protein
MQATTTKSLFGKDLNLMRKPPLMKSLRLMTLFKKLWTSIGAVLILNINSTFTFKTNFLDVSLMSSMNSSDDDT